jgi:hypothetical protein
MSRLERRVGQGLVVVLGEKKRRHQITPHILEFADLFGDRADLGVGLASSAAMLA